MPVPPSRPQFVAIDLETTGLYARSDRVVEFGAVRFDGSGRVLDRFEQLVNPGRAMPAAARAIHGISDADVLHAPPAARVLPRFLAFLGDPSATWLLAHNASFDAGFLGAELRRAGLPAPGHRVFDTLHLARRRRPDLTTHRLDHLVEVLGLDPSSRHRALGDSLRVKELWLRLDGPTAPADHLVSYPVHDPREATPPPHGWERLAEAVAAARPIEIVYDGGTRGSAPRAVTPRRFVHQGGNVYLVALCHLAGIEKSFRLDRVRSWTALAAANAAAT